MIARLEYKTARTAHVVEYVSVLNDEEADMLGRLNANIHGKDWEYTGFTEMLPEQRKKDEENLSHPGM